MRPVVREAAGYLCGALLAVLLLVPCLRLDQARLDVPLTQVGDSLYYQVVAKGIVEHGLSLSNPMLGAPSRMNLVDAPLFNDLLHLAALRSCALFTTRPALMINLYYLASFPLIVLCALAVFRSHSIAWPVALTCSLLYAYLPYHLERNVRHLFLACYYLVPLAIMVILWSMEGLQGHRRRFAVAVVVCLALANEGPYYPFFTAFFLVVAGTCASWRARRPRLLLEPLVLAGLMAAVTLSCALPSLLGYGQQPFPADGPGLAPVPVPSALMARNAADAEYFGLRIAQMLLPVRGHVLPPLAALRERYDLRRPPFEGASTSLGIVASAGFVLLLVVTLLGLLRHDRRFADLGVLNLSGLLLATTGGFGSLLALTALPEIRSYARMSIFLAFFALFAVALLLDRWWKSRPNSPLAGAVLAVVLIAGLVDQTGTQVGKSYPAIVAEYARDEAFVSRIEATLPPASAVFQMPVMTFPGSGQVRQCLDYDPARGYLHSHTLRWSYGLALGRDGDLWQRHVERLPASELIDTLCLAGFSGVWLDRYGFDDLGARLTARFDEVLKSTPLMSSDGRFAFFDLTARTAALRNSLTPAEWARRCDDALRPVLTSWSGGFSYLEEAQGATARWCGHEGTLHLLNPADVPRHVTLRMRLRAPQPANVVIESEGFRQSAVASASGEACVVNLDLSPGRRTLRFTCDGPQAEAPGDMRSLVFCLEDFRLDERGAKPEDGSAGGPGL